MDSWERGPAVLGLGLGGTALTRGSQAAVRAKSRNGLTVASNVADVSGLSHTLVSVLES